MDPTSVKSKTIARRSIVTVLLMTKLALLYSGFSWASASLLWHYLLPDFEEGIFTIVSISQGAGMLILAIIGVALRVFSIWSGQDRPNQQQQQIPQNQNIQAQPQPMEQEKQRWTKVIRIFTFTLIACWILVSGLQVDSFFVLLKNFNDQVGGLSAYLHLRPIYLVPGLLWDSTMILVLPQHYSLIS